MFGTPSVARSEVRPLKEIEIFPVCSPVLLNRDGEIKRTRDLTRHIVLDGVGSTHWNDWFASWPGTTPYYPSIKLEDFNQNLAAARSGIGIAMGDNLTAVEELAQGALVRPLKGFISSAEKGYYIITQKNRDSSPLGKVFIDWVIAEAQSTSEFP